MPLSEDAKRELSEAIRIVREDKFEAFVRSRSVPKSEEEKGGEKNPPPGDAGNDKEESEGSAGKKSRRSAYWGELYDDED